VKADGKTELRHSLSISHSRRNGLSLIHDVAKTAGSSCPHLAIVEYLSSESHAFSKQAGLLFVGA
jgi:hypothetical protein